ncbi:protein, SNF2 family [Dictyocaulus viviparus]|uniref:Protein, SNF2 family n=1 Tax=Dictyocaulus viviparus TaxID=29172 RepID=A0A0D8XDA8_DICVI|nr:protein, SNF2 family [Dictyocaulus viviparus]
MSKFATARILYVFYIPDAASLPFASTPISKNPVPFRLLSDSIASLSMDDDHIDNCSYGNDGDRSRSVIKGNESIASLSPYSAKLVNDPLSRGKLRDRLLRRSLAKSRNVNSHRHTFSTLRNEAPNMHGISCIESADDEVVEESVVHEEVMSTDDSDVVVIEGDSDEECTSKVHVIVSDRGNVKNNIAIQSFSDTEDESDDDVLFLYSTEATRQVSTKSTKIISNATKYMKETTTNLEARLENLRIPCGIQEKALAELHKALNSQPGAKELTKTPDGFLCPLKEHQMSGLTWLIWRESCPPNGGILADDMGLGKTLLMIALIVRAKAEYRKKNEADDMGLGKTLLMIALIVRAKAEYRKKNEGGKGQFTEYQEGVIPSNATLVIAPASLMHHWESEIKSKCKVGLIKVAVYHNLRKNMSCKILALNDVVITTYKLVANELRDLQMESPLMKIHWARIILDEAHNIKNRKTEMAKAVCRLAADARWCVTGTPVHNNLWDLYSLIKFLNVEYFSKEDFWKGYVMTGTAKSTERLNLLMKNYVLRREKDFLSPVTENILVDLPMKYNHDHMLQFSEEERQTYTIIYEASRAKVKEMITGEVDERSRGRSKKTICLISTQFQKMRCVLVILLRLRQACSHFHLTKNAVDMEAFQSLGTAGSLTTDQQKDLANITIDSFVDPLEVEDLQVVFERKFVSAKINVALNLLECVLKHKEKCVIVSQWTSLLKILEQHIVSRFSCAKCSTISGDVQPQERQRRVEDFNKSPNGINIMLISISAGGVGLNLTGGNHLILMDLHWNPALELQARDRIHRMGQTREVHIHKLVIERSIEERVLALQMKKMKLATNVLKGPFDYVTSLKNIPCGTACSISFIVCAIPSRKPISTNIDEIYLQW